MEEYLLSDSLIATHYGDEYEKYLGAVIPPVFLNSLHIFSSEEEYLSTDKLQDDKFIYGRHGNPTVRLLEKKIAALEHGKMALCFGSGMAAATTAILSVCKAGGHVICIKNSYGPVKDFLLKYCVPNLNMQVTFVSGERVEEFSENIRENTQLIILESPSSVVFKLQDLRSVTSLAKAHGIRTYIDNTYCSPVFQKPLDMGVDFVMHTMSKYLGGHSDIIGGVLVSKDEELMKDIAGNKRDWLGGILGPMEAWLAIRGLRTLAVRVKEHEKNATAVAEFLEKHPRVKKVNYPGLQSHPQYDLMKKQQSGNGGLLSFEVDADPQMLLKRVNSDILKIFKVGVSWGGFESLILMPFAKLSQEEAFREYDTSPSTVRVYCGLEGQEHQIRDLENFLNF